MIRSTLLAALVLSCSAVVALGEDLLRKKSGSYLGWRKSSTKFQTCSGGRLDIGTGKVLKTQEKCKKRVFHVFGVLVSVNREEDEFTLRDPKGELMTYPLPAEEVSDVSTLAAGVELAIEIEVDDSSGDLGSYQVTTVVHGDVARAQMRMREMDTNAEDRPTRTKLRKD